MRWVFLSCVPSRSGMTRAGESHTLTCDVAEHPERPQGPAAVGVDVEEARGVASVPVHLAGLLIEGWGDTKAAERRRCWALRVPLEDQQLLLIVLTSNCGLFPFSSNLISLRAFTNQDPHV